jgi:Holliday junction resolvase RusA-like endonuclease
MATDTDLLVAFTVLGEAAPQGSKTKTRFGGIREANPRTRPWRQAVAAEALLAMGGRGPRGEPVEMRIRYFFPRPRGHYGTGRNAAVRKPSAPEHKLTAPDTSKLNRAAEDAMSGIVYRDDAQIVHTDAWKLYGSPARAEIEVRLLAHDRSPPVPLRAA